MTYYDQENQFLRQRLQKEIPIFDSINSEFISGTGPEISFEWSKNTGNIWI